MTENIDTSAVKQAFADFGLYNFVSLVEYLEAEQRKGLVSVHLTCDLVGVLDVMGGIKALKGLQIGSSDRTPLKWCEEFADAIPILLQQDSVYHVALLEIDGIIGEIVFESKHMPVVPLSSEDEEKLNGGVP